MTTTETATQVPEGYVLRMVDPRVTVQVFP